jgi:multidrug efflux pump subunit AcrB
MGGVVGRMFNEFGLVIAFAILISGVVSLTLTPMLCSRWLKPIDHHEKHNALLRGFEWGFTKITNGYGWALRHTVRFPRVVLAITIGTFVATALLFQAIPKGFFPSEDIGQIQGSTIGPGRRLFRCDGGSPVGVGRGHPARPRCGLGHVDRRRRQCGGDGEFGRIFIMLRDKPERTDSAQQVIARLRRATAAVPGINVYFQAAQSINISTTQSRAQYQFGMRSSDLNLLREYGPLMEARMRRIPSILDVNSDLQVRARSALIDIDRDIASRLGVSVDQIRLLLYSAFGSRQVSTIYASDDTYQVILEADPKYGDAGDILRRLQVRTPNGGLVPLDTLAKRIDKPTSLTVNHIAQLPSVMISFNLAPGVALGEAPCATSRRRQREIGLPASITTSFEGSAQVFQQAVANQGHVAASRLCW